MTSSPSFRRKRRLVALRGWPALALVAVAALGIGATGAALALHKAPQAGAAPNAASTPAAPRPASAVPLDVRLTPELERVVTVGALEKGTYEELLRVAASVQADEQRVSRIGSAVNGRVTEIFVQLGDPVRAGQRLATVTSPELATAQMNYLQSLNTAQFSQRAVERAQLLLSADVIGSAELQRREMELNGAKASVDANRSLLRVLGMTEPAIDRLERTRQVDPVIAIVATRPGVVIERKLSQGQVVQPSDPVFTVADLSQVWISADVPEQHARGLMVGDRVEADVPSLGEVRFSGRLVFVGSTVNPDTRTIQVRMNVPNADGTLKPAMLATMLVRDDAARALVIPREAVVREGDRDQVFVEVEPGLFRLTPVRLGAESQGVRPVLGGVGKGDRLVLAGAFHVNAARKLAQAN